MSTRDSYPPGTFSWTDLATSDAAGAKAFYTELFGWDLQDMPAGEDMTYTMAHLHGDSVAALYESSSQEGPPHWNSYVTVDSADDAQARAAEAGATIVMPAFDVLDVGRQTVIQDPTGAFLSLWEPRGHIGAYRVNEPGTLTWNDLSTTDTARAREFYSQLFGWSYDTVSSDRFEYHVIKNGDRSNGGIRPLGEQELSQGAPPNWMPYFGYPDVEEAVDRLPAVGARLLTEVMPMPQGKILVAADPQGAVFALWSGDYDD